MRIIFIVSTLLIALARHRCNTGFRHRVLKLVQQQDTLTVDTAFTVPLGTEIRYTSSCKYDDSSREISSESDYRATLENEAKFDVSQESSFSSSINNVLFKASASFNRKTSFSASAKYKSFTDTSLKEDTVTFEARAICSEYEAKFNPDSEKFLDETFEKAMNELPCIYDRGTGDLF